MMRRRRETRLELAARIADAYGLVLLLILATFVVTMSLPSHGAGGRIAAVAIAAVTAGVAFSSSGVRPPRQRLANGVEAVTVGAAVVGEVISSARLLGVAFGAVAILLAVAAGTMLRRVVTSERVNFRTILGAISVYTLFGMLFAFLFLGVDRWVGGDFFTGVAHPVSSDYVFFSYTTLTTTGYGNLVPAENVGQTLAVIEMLMGQIFLVTLVAGLVSLWQPKIARGGDEQPD
jgi:hypothetical protein